MVSITWFDYFFLTIWNPESRPYKASGGVGSGSLYFGGRSAYIAAADTRSGKPKSHSRTAAAPIATRMIIVAYVDDEKREGGRGAATRMIIVA